MLEKKENEREESIIPIIDHEDIIGINIFSTLKGKSDLGIVLWTDKAGKDITYGLFRALQTEMGYFNYLKENVDLQGNIIEPTRKLLYSQFHSIIKKEIEQEKPELDVRIENALIQELEKEIERLNEYKFSSEDILYEISLDQIKDIFSSLRDNNIKFYKAVLEDFKKNKQYYIDQLKTLGYSPFA